MIFRRKLRYVLVETTDSVNFGSQTNIDSLKKRMLEFLGQLPYFKANPQIASQLNDKVFVMSVNRGHERNAILALSFIKRLNEQKLGFYTIKTSGTIRSLREYFSEVYR